jgi:hypothetical protein
LSVSPTLLRRRRRRAFRRLVFVGALALMLLAPSAAGQVADESPPVITLRIFGTLGLNGWYTSTVTVNWQITDPDGPVTETKCMLAQTLPNDTAGTELTCEATSAGGTTTVKKPFKIDKTPPAVATSLERQADSNGWYNRPLTVAWSATDATSGVDSCSSVTYAGPDNPSAAVAGSCKDFAGNTSNSSYAFKYDSTAPTVSAVTATPRNRAVQLAWRASSDTRAVEVLRAPGRNGLGQSIVYRGVAAGYLDTGLTVGRRYEYRVTGIDEAANRSEYVAKVVATGALLSPAPAASVSLKALPTLQWTPVKGARYYNVQLIRGHKVLSAWPVRPSFRLRRTWTYNRQRQRLRPGKYRWYVWSRTNRGFRLLGSSTFVVMK